MPHLDPHPARTVSPKDAHSENVIQPRMLPIKSRLDTVRHLRLGLHSLRHSACLCHPSGHHLTRTEYEELDKSDLRRYLHRRPNSPVCTPRDAGRRLAVHSCDRDQADDRHNGAIHDFGR